jgi:hypothetical protein
MASQSDSVLALLESPKVRPSMITMLVVGALLGYAIKIAVDAFKAKQTPV